MSKRRVYKYVKKKELNFLAIRFLAVKIKKINFLDIILLILKLQFIRIILLLNS